MTSNLDQIRAVLQTHYDESVAGGIVEKSPSRLARGEGVQSNFYILKIDLANSTLLLRSKHKSTYLKLAHTFLSTMDRISQAFGADTAQTEYAGDGLLIYFAERETSAEDVLKAACWMNIAVSQLSRLDNTLGQLQLKCKIVLHFAELTVAKIGPRNDSSLTAIGYPIHTVAKLEKDVGAGVGRVTKDFYAKLPLQWRRYLEGATFDIEQAPAPMPAAPSLPLSLASLAKPFSLNDTSNGLINRQVGSTAPDTNPSAQVRLSQLLQQGMRTTPQPPVATGLVNALRQYVETPRPPTVPYTPFAPRRTTTGYDVKWTELWQAIQ